MQKTAKWIDGEADEVLETLNNVTYIGKDGKQAKGTVHVVKKGDEVGFRLTKFTAKEIDDFVQAATKNPDAKKVMLGKFNPDISKISYNREAGKVYTFFEMDNWDDVYKLVNEVDDEIWKINAKFIDDQFSANKPFYFSHDPLLADRFFKREVEYLTKIVKDKGKSISFIKEDKYWKAIW